MQVLILPARRGLQWLVEGQAIFRLKPALLAFIVLGCWLATFVVSSVPYIGQFLRPILIPAFTVSLMNACRIIEKQEAPPPQILFSGFHRNIQPLFMLGVVYIVSSLAILGISSLLDGGQLFRMFVLGDMPGAEEPIGTSTLVAAQLALVMLIPVIMALWFAPILVAWHDMSAGKSLFFSLVACARNWRAFLVYLLALCVFCFVLLWLLGFMLMLSGGAMSGVFFVMVGLVSLPPVYASFYVSYRDVFANSGNEA